MKKNKNSENFVSENFVSENFVSENFVSENFVSEIEILSDPDIMRQLKEGKNAKTIDFEDLAKELGI